MAQITINSKKTLNRWGSCLILLGAMALGGCSSAPDQTQATANTNQVQTSSDPHFFEGFNRAMWNFNYNYLDPYFVRPVSVGYVEYTPSSIRTGISNFLSNLDEPASFMSNLLMGNFEQAGRNFNRFWVNSIFGIAGIFDIATPGGIEKTRDREFGDVLGHYGIGKGAYIMAPGYGPFVVRDTADIINPNYFILDFWGSAGKWALQGLEDRYAYISQEDMLNSSPDAYSLVRSAYLQSLDF
ncbi:MAG: MlaA family lipoprotein, partial [Vibrio sp.]